MCGVLRMFLMKLQKWPNEVKWNAMSPTGKWAVSFT